MANLDQLRFSIQNQSRQQAIGPTPTKLVAKNWALPEDITDLPGSDERPNNYVGLPVLENVLLAIPLNFE